MLALLNQYMVAHGYQSGSGLGNVNAQLYHLAGSAPSAFHDIVSGNNLVACVGSRCSAGSTTPVGYSATTGYDQVTGLGSLDAYNLVTAWHTGSLLATTTAIGGATNAASYQQFYAPGMVMSIFGTQLASTTSTASTLPLPTVLDNVSVTVNGVAAPLYYISPTQLNVQIPYETPSSGKVTLEVSNHGQTSSTTIQMSAVAPGIFFDGSSGALIPTATATPGQTVTLYMTGAGAVQPYVATGAVPGDGSTPIPAQNTQVTVGGVDAATSYVGVPSWSVGVLQINFTVPLTAAPGPQLVVVSVGGVASAGATLTVTQ